MMNLHRFLRGARFGALIGAVLVIAACAQNPNAADQAGGAGGMATPGSAQDFVVNVGDRVFFETDSIRSHAASPRHARQAGTMAESVQPLCLHG